MQGELLAKAEDCPCASPSPSSTSPSAPSTAISSDEPGGRRGPRTRRPPGGVLGAGDHRLSAGRSSRATGCRQSQSVTARLGELPWPDNLAILVGYVDRNPPSTASRCFNAAALCGTGQWWPLPQVPAPDLRRVRRGTLLRARAARCGPSRLPASDSESRSARTSGPILTATDRRLYAPGPGCRAGRCRRRDPDQPLGQPLRARQGRTAQGPVRRLRRSPPARFFVYVNQVGGNDELVFDGHSIVVRQGRPSRRPRP